MYNKNMGILAHVDAGKTTLTEQLLYCSGAIRTAGRVDDGTAQTDSLSIERERGISVRASCAVFDYDGCEFSIIDTPGHVDFAGEVERALGALDFGVLVVSGVEGIQSHTEAIYRALSEYELPRLIFINKIDRAGSDVSSIISDFSERFSGSFLMMSKVSGEGSRECKCETLDLTCAVEVLAEIYDDIAELYLSDEPVPEELIKSQLCEAISDMKVTPVLCGSALCGIGIMELLKFMRDFMPDSSRKAVDKLSALIFKIEHDKTMGKIAHVRMFGGEIKSRDMVTVSEPESKSEYDDLADEDSEDEFTQSKKAEKEGEKVTQIRRFVGSKYTDVGIVKSGEIAALCGISSAKTGAWLGEVSVSDKYQLANPFLCVKVTPEDSGKLTETVAAIRELCDEEPYLNYRWEYGEREININLTGEIQLEIIDRLLRERYNLNVEFSPPSVIYKETPSKAGYGFEAYTMPKPCWAVVKLLLEPLPRGSGIEYKSNKIPSNQMKYKYQRHVRKSVLSSLEQGNYGWELTDMRITLVDGEHHFLHTHPLDFFVATPMALMDGLRNTGTTLLEPLIKVRITAPTEYMGKIVNDIIRMEGEFDTPVSNSVNCTIEGILPVAQSMDYTVRLAQLTSGKAVYSQSFAGYRDCPLEKGKITPRRGVNPLDRSKWILYARGAMRDSLDI